MKNMPAFFALGTDSASGVTWNPADKSTDVSLSSGNLVATRNSGTSAYRCARATSSKDYTGNGYFEIAITTMDTGGFITLGIATSSASLTGYVGSDVYGWGYYGAEGGKKLNGGTLTTYGTNFAQGDVIGVAFKNGKIWFAKNNTWNGSPSSDTGEAFSGITGTLYPMVGLYDAVSPVDSITARFKTSAFSYSPPSGFSAWE
jgi:hypothetical protein